MDFSVILLGASVALLIFLYIASRNSRRNTVWVHRRETMRVRTVGPCAVAVGVYKSYEDRKQLERMYSKDKQ